ncbi:MAG: cob(I)yrinic acid a,c-diamide adenosyltransferase [Anaerolineae bacterium]|nr:cob(I)yrinic acid a,c-diamide adenosyltransferase [Anaerolineae bacterium]MDW8102147.1 cob(I)yrinic acid a,c-diamide adenosyltransferase [Anaerolineae bacterium]
MSLKKGLIEVYTGDGKGKTTAALGLALRAAGHGLKTCIIQFMKGWPNYGELKSVGNIPEITLRQFGGPHFVDRNNPSLQDIEMAHEALEEARRAMLSGQYDIIVLDEINVALDFGLLSLEEVIALLEEKPEGVELILTGRNAHPEIIKRAHLVTEMKEVKHPYREGIVARKGIDY